MLDELSLARAYSPGDPVATLFVSVRGLFQEKYRESMVTTLGDNEMSGEFEFILVTIHDGVAVVTFNRPDKLNAWHAPMRREVVTALERLNVDDSVGAIVVTGAGDRAFGAGQDLAEATKFDGVRAEAWMDEWTILYGAVRALHKPIIAAVNGVAAGSAFQFTLLCDMRIGHARTRMGQPEINSGIPSVTGVWLMWDVLGRAGTTELVLTGRLLDGEEAFRRGLLNRLVAHDEVLPTALELAADLAAKPPVAMRLTKQRLRELTESAFVEVEAAGKRIQGEAFATGEPQAVMARFLAARGGSRRTAS